MRGLDAKGHAVPAGNRVRGCGRHRQCATLPTASAAGASGKGDIVKKGKEEKKNRGGTRLRRAAAHCAATAGAPLQLTLARFFFLGLALPFFRLACRTAYSLCASCPLKAALWTVEFHDSMYSMYLARRQRRR